MAKFLDIVKDYYGKENLKFPDNLGVKLNIDKNEIVCELELKAKRVKEDNMQKDCNAFEGWSIILFPALKDEFNNQNIKIRLCLDNYDEIASNEFNGHMARFLYRAERFCKQYTWFELSDDLDKVLKEKEEVFRKCKKYTNNVPEGEAGVKDTDIEDIHVDENVIEITLAEELKLSEIIGKEIDFGSNHVYRQLPVGLFRNKVKKENRVFTGGKSAIDLWSWNGDTFHVVELKTRNPMIGIVTEIFFYANFMRDLLVDETFILNDDGEDRGYEHIRKHYEEFKKISGIMLADKYHPTLEKRTKEILDVMNDNGNAGIQYYKIDYNYELKVTGGSK